MYRHIAVIVLILFHYSAFSQYYWTEISENVPSNLPEGDFTDISCVEGETWITLFAQGKIDGVILHSDDGCVTFTVQELQSVPYAIHMVTTEIGFVGCINGDIYFTSNGGEIWKQVPANFDKQINGMTGLPEPLTGYACSEDGWIIRFDTNHIISQEKPFGSWLLPIDLFDIEFPTDTSEGWVCGSEMTIGYYSNNGWDTLAAPFCDVYYGIDMLNGTQKGWCVGGQGTFMTPEIVHTEDGENWYLQSNPLFDHYLYDVHFINYNDGWSVGGHILGTMDGGITWVKEAEVFPNVWRAVSSLDYAVYIVGNHKRILKKDILNAMDEKLTRLSVILFPNPFTTSTTFSYTLEKPENVQIILYNLQGQIVERFEMEQPNGPQQVQWNAEGLPAGLYIIRLQAGNDIAVRKLIVVE